MKKSKTLVCFAILTSSMLLALLADELPTGKETDLPRRVGIAGISSDVREAANTLTTSEQRVAYLSSVITSNAGITEIEKSRKASAIRLLGVIKSPASVGILISNITFVDEKNHENSSVRALAEIGEPAVPYLLEVFNSSTATPETYRFTAQALQWIKDAKADPIKYFKYVLGQEEKMPKEAYERFCHYNRSF